MTSMMDKQKIFAPVKWIFKSRLRIGAFVILILLAGFFIWRTIGNQKQQQYQTVNAEKGTLIVDIAASGQVSSANNTSVTTQASGVVRKVYVQNGQAVKAGEKIAELELDLDGKLRATQAWSNYQNAQNNLEQAKATLYTLDSAMWAANRKFINDAVARGLTTDDPTYIQEHDDWLAAEAKYKNQQNVVNQAQSNLNSAWLSYQQSSPIIYAPISGIITGLSLQNGAVLVAQSSTSGNATAQKIASIKTDAKAQLIVNLTEIDVTKVKIGNKATVTLDALPGKTYTGKVVSIDTIGAVNSGVTNYPAVISLDTEVPEILPNMAVNAKIITNILENVILVPNAAVSTINGQSTVRILKEGKISEVAVQVAGSNDTQTGIISGISEGDTVVINIAGSAGNARNQGQRTQSPFSGFGGGGVFRLNR